MDEPTVLRTTKIGGGFVKEDVLTYLDELNSKIDTLQNELKEARETGPADPQELIKYRNQVDSLQEKLNASNNALRNAKKENEDLKKQIEADQKVIAQLKAGGAAPAQGNAAQINAQTAQALEAAKKEIENLRNQLKAAEQKAAAAPAQGNAQANAQAAQALEAAKKEIDSLRNQLKAAEQKANNASAAPAGNAAADAELQKAKEEIAKITGELQAKSKEVADVTAQLNSKDSKIEELTKEAASAAAKKDEEIDKLNAEIIQLKETAANPAAQMGTLFAEAQKTVTQLKIQAEQEAQKTTREASEKAEQILNEANATAEKTINNANTAAQAAINEANAQAKTTVDDANKKADKINEMSATVRKMLINEIDSVNARFGDITAAMNKLTAQATDRMGEAQSLIGEARLAVGIDDGDVKKAAAPQAGFEAAKAPSATLDDIGAKKPDNNGDPFAALGSGGYNKGNTPANNSNPGAGSYAKPAQNPAPAQAPAQENKPKKSAGFNFDMSELLKAAEAEAAKDTDQ